MACAVGITLWLSFGQAVFAQPTDAPSDSASPASTNATESLAALELELTNAFNGVLKIVNQPVRAFARTGNMVVSVYRPGWFHAGANRPDFNHVDVRQTQELTYAKDKYVSSDLNPGIVFLGQELEFNANTKYFYTNRSLPKHKLSEAEMLEINRLYRIIGRCEAEILRMQSPAVNAKASDGAAPAKDETETETVVPGQSFESIRAIPKETRLRYGGIAIGGLLVMVILLRLVRKKSG